MGFGKGASGTNGNGLQLLVIIFVELFGGAFLFSIFFAKHLTKCSLLPVTLGQLIGAISPNIQTAALFNPFIGLILTQFCGVTIPFPTMAKFWRSWLYQLVPYTRTLAAMLSTELQ